MRKRRSAILTYHSLDATDSVISVRPAAFRSQMKILAEQRIPVVALEEITETAGAIAITFDDGFRNFYEEAFGVLAEYKFPATVFVVSGYCGRRNNWPSQPPAGIPDLELMSWDQIAEIARYGIGIGGHTVTHPFLADLSEAEREAELNDCRCQIEDRIGKSVTTFAYPYGSSNHLVRCQTGAHFRLACSTVLDYLADYGDPLDLPRLDVYYLRKAFWFRRLGTALGRSYIGGRRLARGVRGKFTY